jgi:hypothetical protein
MLDHIEEFLPVFIFALPLGLMIAIVVHVLAIDNKRKLNSISCLEHDKSGWISDCSKHQTTTSCFNSYAVLNKLEGCKESW